MAQAHWYHVFITFEHNDQRISDKHIASFISEDDALNFARSTREYYNGLTDNCYVKVLYNGNKVFELT